MPLDDLVNALDGGADEEEILPLITADAAREADPDGCVCPTEPIVHAHHTRTRTF